jgi:histidine triad (HIT) family protein
MQLTPEIKAQLAEQKKQCIFCKLISGEMEAKKIFEDDKTIAMLDINPAMKGHTLFMLKEHYPIMPYIPADEFKHYFGIIPQLTKAIKSGTVCTSFNVFIANGGAAGQQSPHFITHLLPRDEEDGFLNFLFKKKSKLEESKIKMLQNNFPIMMNNHFGRNPANWHVGAGEVPKFLENIYQQGVVLYEDEKVLCVLPEKGVAPGHIEIYSKEEDKLLENLSIESSAHLFYVASFAATAVFEGLGSQATNIILKSGFTDDNSDGRLSLHVLPRSQGDGLDKILWAPKPAKYDLGGVMEKISGKTWKVKYEDKKIEKREVIKEPEVIQINGNKEKGNEIEEAISKFQ